MDDTGRKEKRKAGMEMEEISFGRCSKKTNKGLEKSGNRQTKMKMTHKVQSGFFTAYIHIIKIHYDIFRYY